MRERNISDVFLDMSIRDFPGLQHDFNESQKNGRGTNWPANIPIPFEEIKKILEKQLKLPVELPTVSPISTNPDIFPQYTSIFEKIERINANNNIARICQAKYLLSESPRQYELSKDLIFNLKMFEWDGTLDIDCLNKLTEDCIAIHLYINEEPGECEKFWFVFRDLLQQMPILVVVMAMAPVKGKDTWYLCVYEIPLAPGKIRDNIRYRDVRRIRSRYPITTPADTDVISERKLLEGYLDNMLQDIRLVIPTIHHICASPLDLKNEKKVGNVQLMIIDNEFDEIDKSLHWRKEISERY